MKCSLELGLKLSEEESHSAPANAQGDEQLAVNSLRGLRDENPTA
jgi:hypothetical protein